eukprot:tig00020943_g16304.t1
MLFIFVQSFCVLAVLRELDLVVQQISRNTEALLGVRPEAVQGDTLDGLVSEESVQVIRSALRGTRSNEELQAAMPLTVSAHDGSRWYGILHRPPGAENDDGGCGEFEIELECEGRRPGDSYISLAIVITRAFGLQLAIVNLDRLSFAAVLELEPFVEKDAIASDARLPTGFTAVASYPSAEIQKGKDWVCSNSAERVQGEYEETKLCQVITEVLSSISRFDRVCCYAFSKEGHGQVMGETLRDRNLPPFFGLRFPASDIPIFSRAIFYSTRARLMLDSHDTGVGLLPDLNPDTKRALDMYFSNARAPTPCCRQFHLNISSRSQLVYSVVVNNKLWGLVTLHHGTGVYVPYKARTSLVGIVQVRMRMRAEKL